LVLRICANLKYCNFSILWTDIYVQNFENEQYIKAWRYQEWDLWKKWLLVWPMSVQVSNVKVKRTRKALCIPYTALHF
jgi:hypothetical protein